MLQKPNTITPVFTLMFTPSAVVLAPEGPWSVATGGAQRKPVDRCLKGAAPEGRQNSKTEFQCQARTRNFSSTSSHRRRAIRPGFRRLSLSADEHHKTEDFKSELLRTFRAHDIAFDEKYVFD